MAQKSQKSLATRNTATLNRTHVITLVLHILYHLSRFLFSSRRSLLKYTLLAGPTLLLEIWLERLSRPTYSADGSLKRAGEDLEAKGLTEYMWDCIYWTWGCLGLVTLIGDRGWWAWGLLPIYTVWAAYGAYAGIRGGMGGLMGGGQAEGVEPGKEGQSKRAAKMEKRGGQKMVYR